MATPGKSWLLRDAQCCVHLGDIRRKMAPLQDSGPKCSQAQGSYDRPCSVPRRFSPWVGPLLGLDCAQRERPTHSAGVISPPHAGPRGRASLRQAASLLQTGQEAESPYIKKHVLIITQTGLIKCGMRLCVGLPCTLGCLLLACHCLRSHRARAELCPSGHLSRAGRHQTQGCLHNSFCVSGSFCLPSCTGWGSLKMGHVVTQPLAQGMTHHEP